MNKKTDAHIRLTAEIVTVLDEHCACLRQSRSQVCRLALIRYLHEANLRAPQPQHQPQPPQHQPPQHQPQNAPQHAPQHQQQPAVSGKLKPASGIAVSGNPVRQQTDEEKLKAHWAREEAQDRARQQGWKSVHDQPSEWFDKLRRR